MQKKSTYLLTRRPTGSEKPKIVLLSGLGQVLKGKVHQNDLKYAVAIEAIIAPVVAGSACDAYRKMMA